MRTLLAAIVSLTLLSAVGCKSDDGDMNGKMKNDKMSMDACPHCAGVQKLTADGKCEKCGMKMAEAHEMNMKSTAGGAGAVPASVDVCAKCAGVQTATADGKCEKCGMKVAATPYAK